MKMVHYRKDGYSMYTKMLRKLAEFQRKMAGHCDPTDTGRGSGTGHCY